MAMGAYPRMDSGEQLRARKIGHVVVQSYTDRPWSQYFCCMVTANRDFVRTHPIATKRALRAILKATDICAIDPGQPAQLLVKWKMAREDSAVQAMKDVNYGRWRQ